MSQQEKEFYLVEEVAEKLRVSKMRSNSIL